MKRYISLSFLFISLISYAQMPIVQYNSASNSSYSIVSSTPAIDESVSGPNLTWTFNQLIEEGTSTDTYTTPTSNQLSTYPGTTEVLTINSILGSTNTIAEVFSKDISNTVSITGITSTDLDLNYTTDNALVGTFPLSYGYSNTDNIAGTYTYTTYSGTFTGTAITTVDAHGTLTTNDLGNGAYTGNVTRLKTIQNFSLTYIIPNAGTAVQTTYYYYDDSTGELVFRSNTITISVPVLNIDQTIVGLESLQNGILDVQENEALSNQLLITINPVEDFLNIGVLDNQVIEAVQVFDISGKMVLELKDNQKSILVDHLQKGFYIATVSTNKGDFTKNFMKE